MSGHYYGYRSFASHFDALLADTYFDIDVRMLSYLPKYRGTRMEHPLIHLRDLHHACDRLRPQGVNEADFMLIMFVYSLTGQAKSWLLSVSVPSMPQWEQMRQLFLKEHTIRQQPQETTYDFLERFKDMWDTCPDFSLPDHVVALNFLDGMNSHEREEMDVMAGGEIMECYLEDVWDLIYQRAACTNPNAPTRSLEDIVGELAQIVQQDHQIMQQNQERTDIALAELSKQISQPSEAVFEMETTISSDEYLETILETESMEEVTEDTKSEFLPTPIIMDDQIKCDSIEEEAELQNEACLTLVTKRNDNLENHAENLIDSPGFVGTCTTDFLIIPDYYLSSHVQDHKASVSFDVKKELCSSGWESWRNGRDAPIKRAGIFEVARSRNRLSIESRSWKRQRNQKRHSTYVWKPGWNVSTADKEKAIHTVRLICRKFDGVRPWAPNL